VSQVEQYRAIVSQEYERLMEEMAVAEEVYQQDQRRYEPQPQLLGDDLMRNAEANELLQALLQDYMTTENMDVNSQEYEDFLGR
jgi:ribosome assembly protein YihI (activator of Der GTPase)